MHSFHVVLRRFERCVFALLTLIAMTGLDPLYGQDVSTKSETGSVLKAGMNAPEFRVERFLKGTPFTSLKRGEVYVLDFWSTGCGHCVVSMPHLTELQREYRDKGVTVCGVNIWEAPEYDASTLETVTKFLQERPDSLDFSIAYDGGAKFMDNAWMHAAEQKGIPCTFVVDREGKVAWVGHPDMLDMVLEEVVRGTWDIVSGPEELKQAEAAFAEAAAKYEQSLRAGDSAWDVAMARYSALGRTKTSQRLVALLRAGHFAAAHEIGGRLIDDARKAHTIGPVRVVLGAFEGIGKLSDDSAKQLLLDAARANFDLNDNVKFAPYARHVVMARAYFRAGRDTEAHASVKQVLDLAPGELRDDLKKYLNQAEEEAKRE